MHAPSHYTIKMLQNVMDSKRAEKKPVGPFPYHLMGPGMELESETHWGERLIPAERVMAYLGRLGLIEPARRAIDTVVIDA